MTTEPSAEARWRVAQLGLAEARRAAPELSAVLIDCVEGGASVSFMAPLAVETAMAFWEGVADGVGRGERLLLVARSEDGALAGTVQVILAQPENQPHRADVAKLLVHRRARRTGAGEVLMRAAEDAARAAGKRLLVLDTASDTARRLYERVGWQLVGRIPDYALNPDGTPCDTWYYYKALAAGEARAASALSHQA
ncbi:MAG: GNAT family N-acetyltransferase [Dehalococcoidia bacterium]